MTDKSVHKCIEYAIYSHAYYEMALRGHFKCLLKRAKNENEHLLGQRIRFYVEILSRKFEERKHSKNTWKFPNSTKLPSTIAKFL